MDYLQSIKKIFQGRCSLFLNTNVVLFHRPPLPENSKRNNWAKLYSLASEFDDLAHIALDGEFVLRERGKVKKELQDIKKNLEKTDRSLKQVMADRKGGHVFRTRPPFTFSWKTYRTDSNNSG